MWTHAFVAALLCISGLQATVTKQRNDNAECCMAQLLQQSHLPASAVDPTRDLLRKNGIDQSVVMSGDYASVTGLLQQIGVKNPLDIFRLYNALHSDTGSNGPCHAGETCQLTDQEEFTCQPSKGAAKSADNLAPVLEEMRKLESELHKAATKINGTTTSYVHWGRNDCPQGSELVYYGWVGGAYHADLGSGANPQCMPKYPTYNRYSDYEWGGIMYPAVYKLQGQNEPWATEYTDMQAGCAVCERRDRTTTMMVPGRNTCPTGWSTEYSGYLTSANFNIDHRSMFLCFDETLSTGSQVSSEHATHGLYVVGIDCRSSNECPPYYNARELTCAVCSK